MECQEQGLQQQNKKKQYEHLLPKYREIFPVADKNQLIKKFNSLRTNFRNESKRIKDSEKCGTGAEDLVEQALWYFEEMKFFIPFTSKLDLNLRKKLVKCYIWSMALYGAETWTLRAADRK